MLWWATIIRFGVSDTIVFDNFAEAVDFVLNRDDVLEWGSSPAR